MCCSKKCSKLILFVFNIIFFLFGAAALALGIFLIVDNNDILGVIGKIPGSENYDVAATLNSTSYLENGAYMLIGAGAVIFVIAFCGLCGGIRESSCLLYIYSVFVGLILVIQIAAGVVCKFYGDQVETYLTSWFTTLITDYYEGATFVSDVLTLSSDSSGVSDAIDFAQVSLTCCGVTNYTDFSSATNWAGSYNFTVDNVEQVVTNAVVPISCCKITNPSKWPASLDAITFTDVNDCLTTGSSASTNLGDCYTSLLDMLQKYSIYAIGVGIGIACLESFGVFAACLVIRQTGDNRRDNYRDNRRDNRRDSRDYRR